MEETNYDRKHPEHPAPSNLDTSEPQPLDGNKDAPNVNGSEKNPDIISQTDGHVMAVNDSEKGEMDWPRKSYLDKLGLKDKPRQNRILDIAIAPFKGFLYPPVVYAGLMYGANSLVWSGTQNATAGTVYTTMYGWTTADVSGAYAGGVIGTILG